MSPEDVDLVVNLRELGRICERTAADIATELDRPGRTLQLAGLLELAARQLRDRAAESAPRVVEAGANPLAIEPPGGPFSASGP